MTDAISGKPPGAGTKPRLSLLCSKQSGLTPNSYEDIPNKPSNLANVEIDDGPHREYSNNSTEASTSITNLAFRDTGNAPSSNETGLVDDQQCNRGNKTQEGEFIQLHNQLKNFGKQSGLAIEDLFRIMTLLKSDIQTKEIALNSFKTEQLKRLINPIEIKKSTLATAYMELQDRIEAKERLENHGNLKPKQRSSSTSVGANSNHVIDSEISKKENRVIGASKRKQISMEQTKSDSPSTDRISNNTNDDDENLNIMIALLELLDRHPLLALPRDAMYCLDYACNDISTKNYLNLKIQGLENLIDQHRRFRFYMSERLKRSEQRYIDLTLKLELERNQRLEKERTLYRSGGKAVLLNHIDQLKEALEKERANKHAIVMTLLNELLDERERSATLQEKVIELEKKLVENKTSSQAVPAAPISATKPRVPAKPAQLLDRQRSQTKLSK